MDISMFPHFSDWSYQAILTKSLINTLGVLCLGPKIWFTAVGARYFYYYFGSWLVLAYCPTPSRKKRSFHLPAFEHVALRYPDSIRLLKLNKLKDGTIEFELAEFRLSNAPPYEALSYVWGPADNNRAIRCGARQLLVTDNCYSALDSLASRTLQRFLWIDSICIDQRELPQSIDERNRQVNLMGEIYKRALRVVVWLGDCDNGSDVAFRYIQFKASTWWVSSYMRPVSDWIDGILFKVMRSMYREGPSRSRNIFSNASQLADMISCSGTLPSARGLHVSGRCRRLLSPEMPTSSVEGAPCHTT